ncbi:MAG: chloramphenicol acetyltransferase [Thermoanaerobaculia bacterium]|nr:chloramphenicol acetyltransferase [Thermoanaerobaculia bacterium]
MERTLDIDGWARRDHFHFFRTYERPFFSICADVDVTNLLARSRQPDGPSFFVTALYLALRSINAIPELRYRLRGESVIEHDRVHGGCTVLLPDDTFAFGFLDYHDSFAAFAPAAAAEIERVRTGPGGLVDQPGRDDIVFFSAIPWISFTSFEHALQLPGDSNPRVVFGRHREVAGRRQMPVSLALHHALADGLHAGRFFESFQNSLDLVSALVDQDRSAPSMGS